MKRILPVLAALLLPVMAVPQAGDTSTDVPDISDYAWGFPIEIGETASFYAVELPLEVNRSVTDAALRDAGVYNGDGTPVSRMFERAGDDRDPVEHSSALPALPLFESKDSRNERNQLAIERDGDSTQFRFDLADLLAPAGNQRLVAYIVDTRQLDDALAAIDLAWEQMNPGFMGRVTVDGGNDLQNWRPIGSAVVAFLREDAASIEQRRIVLRSGDFDYLRIRWEGMPDDWRLSQVLGVSTAGDPETSRRLEMLDATATDPDDDGHIFSLGGAPAVDRLRVVLPEPNSVVSAQVYYWSEGHEHWIAAGRGSFHHIIRDGNAVMSKPLQIPRTRASRFKVLITHGPPDVRIRLEVGWLPDRLLFLAQGQPPFTLAAGNAEDAQHDYPQHRIYGAALLTGLTRGEGDVVTASLGPRFELGGTERLVAPRQIDWRTLLLWLGLVLGVLFVGFMAFKTIRELRTQ